MQSLFGGGELGLLGGGSDAGGLKEDGLGSVAWHSSTLPPDDVYSASHFALITAYQDIKTRLACLERDKQTEVGKFSQSESGTRRETVQHLRKDRGDRLKEEQVKDRLRQKAELKHVQQ